MDNGDRLATRSPSDRQRRFRRHSSKAGTRRCFVWACIRADEIEAKVYDTHVYEQLVGAASELSSEVEAIILLMGDAGLRQGEVRALQRSDLRFGDHPFVRVQRTRSREGEEHAPKGRRNRTVPMTARLAQALQVHLHAYSHDAPHLFLNKGKPMTQSAVRSRVRQAERHAGLPVTGRSHIMRHTFVSDLASANTPARVIQELAGHRDLKTTLRYMHVRDGQAHAAIAGLERHHQRHADSTRTAQEPESDT